jgi:uncharacterized membrane protein YphA (DoxX/SURF4 family)
MRFLAPVGRAMLAALFLKGVPGSFQEPTIAFVSEQGIPLAGIFVPLAGFLALAGGIFRNLAMLGGVLLIAYFGAGPFSMDERMRARPVPVAQRKAA